MSSFRDQIARLMDGADLALISSIDAEGYPNSKAMLPPRKREGIEKIYFSTNTSSIRIQQFRENPKGSVYFFDKVSFLGVMLIGLVKIMEDLATKEMIWRTGDHLYYPLGVTDLDYCVLCFEISHGRYYGGNFESKNFTLSF